MIKIGLVSDKHSGSRTGLTSNPDNPTQEKLLEIYQGDCAWLGKLDYLIDLGDCIDGQDLKSNDLTEDQVSEQVDDAATLMTMAKAKEYFMIAGTPYHTNAGAQRLDTLVCKMLNTSGKTCSYHQKLKLQVADWFYLQGRHKIGSSGIPHGRHTAPSRSKTWDAVNAAINASVTGEPCHLANLLAFGHVHYWTYCEDAQGAALTMPCYQALGGKYGDAMCDGHIDIGCVKIEIGSKGEWAWEKRIHQPKMVSRTVKR
jgi:hypothetical protein